MTTLTLSDTPVEVDAEGFLQKPEKWTEPMAHDIARAAGIDPLTDRHMQVVRFMRDTYLATGTAPTIRTLGKASGVPIKELYQLFPKGPAKLAAKVAGIPKPRGCI
jgi:tRNA 2-thiouridine synthesizing protein E